jgi:hypothetical protein
VRCTVTLVVGIAAALTIGLVGPASQTLTPADAPILLSVDQTGDDGANQILFLVPALTIDDQTDRPRIGYLVSPVTWFSTSAPCSDPARAPPREPGDLEEVPLRIPV